MAVEPILTKYDTIVGDGDCGMTMEQGAWEILNHLEADTLWLDHPSFLFADLADAILASMGGTSGILLELLFCKAGTHLLSLTAEEGGIGYAELANAFREGVSSISFYDGVRRGSGTMLDALLPALAAILTEVGKGSALRGAACAARAGSDETSMMKSEAGRSNYLSGEVLMGTPDPGAIAVAIVIEAMIEDGTQDLSETPASNCGIAEKNGE
jgi:dihydroxyacetone kinase